MGLLPDVCSLIGVLPAAWGLYYSCLDRELALKALEPSQALARESAALQRATERCVCNPKGGGTGRQREPGILCLPLTHFTLREVSFALK